MCYPIDTQYFHNPAARTNAGGAVILYGAERCCVAVRYCGGYQREEMQCLDVFVLILGV